MAWARRFALERACAGETPGRWRALPESVDGRRRGGRVPRRGRRRRDSLSLEEHRGAGLVGGELVPDVLGVHEVQGLREVHVGGALALTGTVHVRTAEDGQEVGVAV